MKHRWHPLAEAEFDEAVDYYLLEADPIVVTHFATVVGKALELISAYPAAGA